MHQGTIPAASDPSPRTIRPRRDPVSSERSARQPPRRRDPYPLRDPRGSPPRPCLPNQFPTPEVSNRYYDASDLHVGNVLEFLGNKFVVFEADEYSLRYMEAQGVPKYRPAERNS